MAATAEAVGPGLSARAPSDRSADHRHSCRRSPPHPCCASLAPTLFRFSRSTTNFHRRLCDRRAFETGFHRTCFGLLGGGLRGFTPRSGAQVQFDLILLPHGSHEITALLVSSTVQAFGGAPPPTMPSADFCTAIRSPYGDLSPVAETPRRPPRGKTDRLHRTPAGFTTPSLDDRGLCDRLLAPRARLGLVIRCLSIGPRLCSTLSSDPISR